MTMQEAYERYYGTKHYDHRYPHPNRLTLARVLGVIEPRHAGLPVIDIGAGNGRYAIPLAQRGHHVVAVERSVEARRQLVETAEVLGLSSHIQVHGEVDEIPSDLLRLSRTVLLLFGVLGHMDFAERAQVLGHLRSSMEPGAHLLGSVPNRLRRFREEQRTNGVPDLGGAPRFTYRRQFASTTNEFEYTAFSPAELRCELATHGWTATSICAESTMSEERVTTGDLVARLDSLVTRAIPSALGYGIYFDARSSRV